MPRPISDEELQLKKRSRRRLVGAIVLVTTVAVILPMVLDSEPTPVTQNVDIQIPSTDSGDFKPKAAGGAAAKGAQTAQPVPAATSSGAPAAQTGPTAPLKGMPPAVPAASKDAGAKPAAAAVVADPKPAAEDRTAKDEPKDASKATTKDTAGGSGAYVVQVAALADGARVKQLQKQMTAAGVKTYTEAIKTNAGEVTRVRAGPYATKEAAESARSQLRKAGLDGKVVPR